MRYLLYSLMLMGSSMSIAQTTTTSQENPETGVVTEKTTTGSTTVVKVKKENRLEVKQLARPEKVRKEAVIEEKKKPKQ